MSTERGRQNIYYRSFQIGYTVLSPQVYPELVERVYPEPRRTGDAQRLLRIDEEAPLKDQKIALLEQQVSNLEKEKDLLKQQNAIQEKLTELAKREVEVYRGAFEKDKGDH